MSHRKAFSAAALLVIIMSVSCGQILGLDDYHAVMMCLDGVQDGSETDVDCGGKDAPACATGKTCIAPSDCQTGVCTGGKCAPPGPTDGVKNGSETDVDCGGGAGAPLCGDTKACALGPRDCASFVCTGNVCQAPTNGDGVKNGTETDIDCGGGNGAPLCAATQACVDGPRDCQSGVCAGNMCQP